MEIKDILESYKIIGIIGKYKCNLNLSIRVKDLKVKNISKALKMVGLDDSYLEKKISTLTISELWKIDLVKKLDNDIIIIGNICDSLIYKDQEYMKKLFIKLSDEYQKKIVIIDNNIDAFSFLAKRLLVIDNKKIIYSTDDFFDEELYNYIKMPKIVEFIKYVNKNEERINNTMDIYELLKDIYRRVS